MITRLSFQNFKSWADTGEVRMAPLVGLFGTNSSGKTSLLQFLLMLKQTTESPDRRLVLDLGNERSFVDLGTFQELVFSHDLERNLSWSLEWNLPKQLQVFDTNGDIATFQSDSLAFSAVLEWKEHLRASDMRYTFGDAEFGMTLGSDKKEQYDLISSNSYKFRRVQGRPWKLPHPAKCYGFPDQVRAYYQNAGFLSDFELEFEQLFSRIHYLGPLREYPKRQYAWSGGRPSDMGRRGERVVEAILASREAGVLYSRGKGKKRQTLEERVAQWLKDLELIHSFEVRPITEGGKLFQVWVKRTASSSEVLITDVGFGVSQILPVITLCYYVPEGSVILLEQPEIHLHPRVQSGLADVLIDAIKTRKVQIIIESHSEHLLRRLQRRIAEEKLNHKDAALYFCSVSRDRSKLQALELDMFGTITNWPKGFFGDEFEEISATQKAILRRKQGS